MRITNEAYLAVKQLLQRHNHGYLANLNNLFEIKVESEIEKCLLPNVWLWNPIQSISSNLRCPHCSQDQELLISTLRETEEWELGQSNSRVPRTIWDHAWYCMVVGKIYQCSLKNHKVVSYHAGILKSLPPSKVPFIFSHRSGMTLSLFDTIVRLINNGTTFQSVERILKENFIDFLSENIRPQQQ